MWPRWPPVYIFFQPGIESAAPFGTIKCHSTWLYCALYPKSKEKWRSKWPPSLQFLTSKFLYPNCKNGGHIDLPISYLGHLQCDVHIFFSNPDLSQAPWKTSKTTPHLLSLFLVQGNDVWPPFDLHFDLVKVKMVIWWQCYVKSFKTTLGCCILKFLESILDFGGHGGQMEVKTRLDCFGDGIFEKYGQK